MGFEAKGRFLSFPGPQGVGEDGFGCLDGVRAGLCWPLGNGAGEEEGRQGKPKAKYFHLNSFEVMTVSL